MSKYTEHGKDIIEAVTLLGIGLGDNLSYEESRKIYDYITHLENLLDGISVVNKDQPWREFLGLVKPSDI